MQLRYLLVVSDVKVMSSTIAVKLTTQLLHE